MANLSRYIAYGDTDIVIDSFGSSVLHLQSYLNTCAEINHRRQICQELQIFGGCLDCPSSIPEYSLNNSTPIACSGNGTCRSLYYSPKIGYCDCFDGYNGIACEKTSTSDEKLYSTITTNIPVDICRWIIARAIQNKQSLHDFCLTNLLSNSPLTFIPGGEVSSSIRTQYSQYCFELVELYKDMELQDLKPDLCNEQCIDCPTVLYSSDGTSVNEIPIPCSDHGTCQLLSDYQSGQNILKTAYCLCHDDYFGIYCEQRPWSLDNW